MKLTCQHKVRLRLAVSGDKEGAGHLAELTANSTHAPAFFTAPLVDAFLRSFTVSDRHLTSHLEFEPTRLLRKLFALELSQRQKWSGSPHQCPETIALRLFLASVGPARASALVRTLQNDVSGQFEPLKAEELLPIGFLLE